MNFLPMKVPKRIVEALREKGYLVGYMFEGVADWTRVE